MKHSFFIEGENERISALLDAQKTFLDDLRRPCEPGSEIKKYEIHKQLIIKYVAQTNKPFSKDIE